MEIISKKKNKEGITEVQFGNKEQMLNKLRKISTDGGYMIRPKINPNLKMRGLTDAEKALSIERRKYQKNDKTTVKGIAGLMLDTGKKIFKRAIGKEE